MPPTPDERRHQFGFYLQEQTMKMLREHAQKTGWSQSSVVEALLSLFLCEVGDFDPDVKNDVTFMSTVKVVKQKAERFLQQFA